WLRISWQFSLEEGSGTSTGIEQSTCQLQPSLQRRIPVMFSDIDANMPWCPRTVVRHERTTRALDRWNSSGVLAIATPKPWWLQRTARRGGGDMSLQGQFPAGNGGREEGELRLAPIVAWRAIELSCRTCPNSEPRSACTLSRSRSNIRLTAAPYPDQGPYSHGLRRLVL